MDDLASCKPFIFFRVIKNRGKFNYRKVVELLNEKQEVYDNLATNAILLQFICA